MRRISIKGMMGIVLCCCVGLASLRSAGPMWVGILHLLTTGILGIALLGMAYSSGSRRAWWLGYLVFSGGYLALTLFSWFSNEVRDELATTQMLDYVHSQVEASSSQDPLRKLQRMEHSRNESIALFTKVNEPADTELRTMVRNQILEQDKKITQLQQLVHSGNRWSAVIPGAANRVQFLRVGHCLFGILAGAAGGFIACGFFYRQEQRALVEVVTPEV